MNAERINLELIEIYDEWLEVCVRKLKEQKPKSRKYNDSYGYSAPFVTGLSSEFFNTEKKKLLVFGQEARDWSRLDADEKSVDIQKRAIEYFEREMRGEKDNSSPFWRMMRGLDRSFSVCWSNLDKLHRVYDFDVKSQQLEYFEEEEKVLLSPLSNGKNIILNEIELIKPDAVLFVTGPNYRKATKYALGMEDYYEKHTVPSINGEVILQLTSYTVEGKSIPVIWTYHPNFMSRHDLEGHIRDLEAMIEKI